jgi:hypothetical protein
LTPRVAPSIPFLLALALLPLFGLLAILEPVLLALPFLAGLVLFALRAPVPAAGLVLFAHVALPIYLRPPVPILSSLPYSVVWMLALMGLGVLAWLAGRPLPPRLSPQGRNAALLFLLLPAAAVISLFDPATDSESLKMFALAIVFPAMAIFLIVGVARTPDDIRRILTFLVLGGIGASLYAIGEVLSGTNFFLDRLEEEPVAGYYDREMIFAHDPTIMYRAFSVFLNPIEFGAVMAMILPVALVRLTTATDPRQRLLLLAASVVLMSGVLLSVSRGPLLSLAVVCVMVGLIFRQLRVWLLIASVAAVLALVIAWPFIGEKIMARFNDSDNVTLRLKLFQSAIATFLDNPVNGVGIGNFPAYYLDTIRDHHIGPFYELGGNRVEKVRVAENAYLQLAAEMGIIGILAAVAAVAAFFRLALRLAGAAFDAETREIAIILLLMAVVYGINALTVTAYTLFGPTFLMIGAMPGIALALDRAARAGPCP